MKKIYFYLILISVVALSCKTEEINTPILVYAINNEIPESYILNSKHKSEFINFEYVSVENINTKLNLHFNKEKDWLLMGLDTLYPIKSIYKPKDLEFKMYQIREKRSHVKTLVFNNNYGLLASLNAKSHKLFLKDSVTFLNKENIFKGLFLELNKNYTK